MDDMEGLLNTVVRDETQAVIHQKQNRWITPIIGAGISGSLSSIQSGGAQNPGYEDDEVEFTYDKADPSRLIAKQEQERNDNLEKTSNSSDDIDTNGDLQKLKMNVKGRLEHIDWNGALSLRTKKGRDILSFPAEMDSTPAADYDGDDVEGSTFTVEKPFKDTKPSKRHSSRTSQWISNAGDKSSSSNIEMMSLTSTARPANRYVSLKESRRTPSAATSSLQEYDPLNLPDLAKLPELTLDNITDCIEQRYKHGLIYTWCGEVLLSANPFTIVDLCKYKYFDDYTEDRISDAPHLYAVSARAYQNIRSSQQNQVILVSGESGAGKTEATKLIVRHLMYIAGSDYAALQDRIIQINPLLEAFGNARTKLNRNSSRFAKFLSLYVNTDGKIESARVKDYMLEKSRVVHHAPGERTFHAFYSFLVGASDEVLQSVFIRRHESFRVTGSNSFYAGGEKSLYKTFFELMQNAFKLIKLNEEEIQDIYTILAAILHLGNVEFEESDNDSVIIKNEDTVEKVATLLQLDVEQLTKVLIERTGRLGTDQNTLYEIKSPKSKTSRDTSSLLKTPSRGNKLDNEMFGVSRRTNDDSDDPATGEILELSKNKKQADDERDATAKSLYERLFGWLVRKINDSLRAFSNPASIGILDICGFEDLGVNSFEQLCINLVNEQLQNFMNKRVIEEERELYLQEGVQITDVDIESINNDAIIRMFMEKKSGILAMIDEDSKLEFSNDEILVTKLTKMFGKGGILIPSAHNTLDFRIRHFAGEVSYDARSFIQKNRDTLSESMKACFRESDSTLIQDLFSVQESHTGSISMANYEFRGSRKAATKFRKLSIEGNMSQSINTSRKASLQQKFGNKNPTFQSGDLAQRSTHIKFFRNSMDELLNAMRGAHPYFVRCIKPNDRQMPGEFSRDRVMAQLRYNGVKEIARIRTFRFPIRLSKEMFRRRYGDLADPDSKSDLFRDILCAASMDDTDYKVGQTQIFMKESVQRGLESALENLRQQREQERLRTEEEMRMKEENMFKHKKGRDTQLMVRVLQEELNNQMPFLSVPMETIVETSTPGSLQDDYIYNKTTASSSTEIRTTAESEDESSEDETSVKTPIEEPKEEAAAPAWDITQELNEEEERYDVHEQPILMVIKSIVYILLFLLCLASFVFQKLGLLFLTTNLKHDKTPLASNGANIQQVAFLFLIVALCIPYALGWLFALAKICFGNFKRPSVSTWLWVIFMETCHAVGLCLLVFRILPNLDIIRSVMLLSATAILPSVLKFVMSSSDFQITNGLCLQCSHQGTGFKILRYVLDFFMMLFQISVIPLIIVMGYFDHQNGTYIFTTDSYHIAEIVAAFVLVSCAHWENFTDGRLFCELKYENWFKNVVLKIRFDLQNGRHYPHLFTFLWKIGITILLGYYLNLDDGFSYDKAFDAFTVKKKPIQAKAVAAAISLMVSAFVAFFASFGACVFQMQVFSLTIPAMLAMPVTIGILYLNCHFNFLDFLQDKRQPGQEGICLGMDDTVSLEKYWYHFLFGFAWWLSLVVLSRHMWRPKLDRAANIARLFVNPSYCSILTCESIMLNRIRNPSKVSEYPEITDDGDIKVVYYKLAGKPNENEDDVVDVELSPLEKPAAEENPATPMLYACATMWHETRTEMVQLLKSLHRLDRDQYIRRLVNEKVKGFDPEFYNFEAHIFFDDAMEPDDYDEQVPNKWVKELVASMDVACSSVHGKPMKVHPPIKVPTPYGGQLIWQMPGENLLFVHMKDIKKIRNRKRWSQVMYMHYLLGYRHIMMSKQEVLEKMQELNLKKGHHGLNINEINYLLGEESAVKAQNTFILALDGDTDFSPGSIKILLDRMKDEKVGAACGRIHPIGNGPMVWYQKFEYSIGHWLQKAAEHVFGCVLCSPGCFSLFRGSALLDTNVMKRYTTEPTEPSHHLQYDQGEDRWLCTLLLQQGYRIEYAAAADAWTFAPEGFFEFFNQRRRWMPSTIANILDLLNSASLTTKRNANMSFLYIAYQWLLMLMTILGPGTIIMMIAGAVKLVFKFSLIDAYVFSTVPAIVFIIACFWFSSKVQLHLAGILSILYSFIMMIVLVGTIITATTEDILHPSVVVIVMLVGIFVLAGLCHPQEIWCLLHGVLYLLTIPSGYLLLVIYSICNLNDVSWGTREVPTKAQRLEMERKKKEKEEQEKNKPKRGFFAKIFNRGEEHIREMTKLIRTIMPQRAGTPHEQLGLNQTAKQGATQEEGKTVIQLLEQMNHTLKKLLNKDQSGEEEDSTIPTVVIDQPWKTHQKPSTSAATAATAAAKSGRSVRPKEPPSEVAPVIPEVQQGKRKRRKKRDELKNPLWAEDRGLGNGVTIVGNAQEMTFWRECVDRYLLPIRPSAEEKKKIADGLRDLRNSSTFAMIIVNLLWMALNFMFQLTNAARFTIRYGPNLTRKIEESVLGMGFVMLLLILLLLQMVGMFIHRIGTLQHLLAITQIRVCKAQEGNTSDEKRDREDAIRHIKEVLKIPMTGDVGAMTQPPTLADPNTNNWGMTVLRPSARGTLVPDYSSSRLMEIVGHTIQNNKFAMGRSTKMYDPRTQEALNNVKQRLVAGSAIQKLRDNDEFGKSFRPRLPPRGRSFHQPMMMQASNFGFTQRELDRAKISVHTDLNQPNELNQMGAMGRSLYVRSKVINETSNEIRRNSSMWSDNDKPMPKKYSFNTEFNHM